MGISVVIPLYNKAATVDRAIRSALQPNVNVEVIVVDDGSTDGSDRIVQSFGPDVVYVRQNNSGPSAARNRGVDLAKFPVVTFLDADDEFLPGCLEAHLACRRLRPETKISLSPFRVLRDGHIIREERIIERLSDTESLNSYGVSGRLPLGLHSALASGSICVDKDFFKTIGGFDPELRCWEITYFMYRVVRSAVPVCVLPDIRVHIHQQPASSQFESTQNVVKFRQIYAQKLADDLGSLDDVDRNIVLNDLKGSMKSLLADGAIDEFRDSVQRVQAMAKSDRGLRRLCMLSHLPNVMLYTGVVAWGTFKELTPSSERLVSYFTHRMFGSQKRHSA
jgi:glycosyltransferase involved in cell wall biosynthesis